MPGDIKDFLIWFVIVGVFGLVMACIVAPLLSAFGFVDAAAEAAAGWEAPVVGPAMRFVIAIGFVLLAMALASVISRL